MLVKPTPSGTSQRIIKLPFVFQNSILGEFYAGGRDICPQHPIRICSINVTLTGQGNKYCDRLTFLQGFTIHTWPPITFEPRRGIKLLHASFQVYPEFNGILMECNASISRSSLTRPPICKSSNEIPAGNHCHNKTLLQIAFFSRARSNFFLFFFFFLLLGFPCPDNYYS